MTPARAFALSVVVATAGCRPPSPPLPKNALIFLCDGTGLGLACTTDTLVTAVKDALAEPGDACATPVRIVIPGATFGSTVVELPPDTPPKRRWGNDKRVQQRDCRDALIAWAGEVNIPTDIPDSDCVIPVRSNLAGAFGQIGPLADDLARAGYHVNVHVLSDGRVVIPDLKIDAEVSPPGDPEAAWAKLMKHQQDFSLLSVDTLSWCGMNDADIPSKTGNRKWSQADARALDALWCSWIAHAAAPPPPKDGSTAPASRLAQPLDITMTCPGTSAVTAVVDTTHPSVATRRTP